ncbi:MAG: hypothetical protein ACT4OX_02955 [Actinomycetota bacterium]
MTDDADADPIDLALREIEASASAKLASGEISTELEATLDAEFRDIAGHHGPRLDEVARRIKQLRELTFEVPDPASTSSMPGGALVHRVVSTTVRRHNQYQADQMKVLRNLTIEAIEALDRRLTEGLDDLERRRRRAVNDLRAELAALWHAVGAADGAP